MTTGRVMRWIGWVITGLTALMFLFSASMKLVGGPEIQKAMEPLGLPGSLLLPLAILELSCLLVYLLPPTSVLGAILLTGYLGGAILTHVRVGEPFVFPLVLGILVWLGLYLRDERLRQLIPLRRPFRG